MGRRIEATPLPRIAATYARVSTVLQDSGDKSSLDTQEAGCQRWALDHDWLLDDRFAYRDRHSGEELWERPALTELREAARARSFGVLVCHSIDRLSRDPIHLGILIEELTRLGITVEFVTEELDDTPEAALIRFIKGYAGKIENERRRERQMRATRARVERGLPVATGRKPFGYLWTDATKTAYMVDPATAPVVVRIFADYARGMTLRELAAALTADGVPTATSKRATWDPGVVRNLLRTSLYWGAPTTGKTRSERVPLDRRAQYRGKSVARVLPREEQTALPPTTAPALVSHTVAAEVLRRLRCNQQLATRSAKDPESALLRGLVRCGLCGSTMHANRVPASRRADGSVPVRYVCRQALKVRKDATAGRYCTPHSMLADVLDPAVWDQVAAYLLKPQLIAQERARMREAEPPGTADLAALDARVAAIGRRISSLMETAEYVSDSDARRDLAAQIGLYTKQKRKTEAERAQVAVLAVDWDREALALESLTTLVQHATVNLESWGYAEKRSALLALKTVVTLHPPGHTPRAEGTIRLPLRGVLQLAPALGVPVTVSSDAQYVR
jgi:site-specific DNA recombinase